MQRLGLVRVRGRSMEPTLSDGDLLLVLYGGPPRLGSLAVVRLPRDEAGAPRPLAVKRLTGLDPEDASRYWVERDNPREGIDSWQIGSLAASSIRARVLFRIPHRRRTTAAATRGGM